VVLGWERWLLVEAGLEVLLRRGFVLERGLEWLVVLGSLVGVRGLLLRRVVGRSRSLPLTAVLLLLLPVVRGRRSVQVVRLELGR